MAKGDLPILVGVGQSLSHWDGTQGPTGAPSPLSLMVDASRAALKDAGLSDAAALDMIAVNRIFEDSVPGDRHPHGHNKNLPGTLARDLNATTENLIYQDVGGHSPQGLVNEMATRIHAGELECVLLTGSEANKASKGARKNKVDIDWTDDSDLSFEDRGMGPMLLSRDEIKHGLVTPAYFYGLFENAIAARENRTRSEHRKAMAELFQPFSQRASENEFSQFPQARTVDFLATPSAKNYEYADPFLKWFIAQDAVNQGASVILTSESKARELNIPESKWVYLHGAGQAGDDYISVRPMLDGSWAMQTALDRALEQAGAKQSDIAHFDLYSCFPCAVFSSTAALGIDWASDKRALTQTGGLPFFGGPGNNYSMHGIAAMVETLRANSGDRGLVLANGGWMTKEAAGIYSTTRPDGFTPTQAAAKPTEQVELSHEGGRAMLETFTVAHGKGGPEKGIIFARASDGRRLLANASPAALTVLREDVSPVGRSVDVTVTENVGLFDFS